MTVMKEEDDDDDDVYYTVTQTDADLQHILELQAANPRPESLSEEEWKAQDFVTARHTRNVLPKMHPEYPHSIAKSRHITSKQRSWCGGI